MTRSELKFMTKAFIATFCILIGVAALVPPVKAQENFIIPTTADIRGPTYIRNAPTYVQARVLAANTAETIAFPAGTNIAVFAATCNFYASTTIPATVPAADVTNGTASELNPSAWYFAGSSAQTPSVSVITSDASCIVTASAYKGAKP